ncbi:hypothetical protein RHGRI_013405 [Rhododendron griersonianum]|uniref:Jacalin-type lectin domain-containing protein n=1 Tax=Rhododendron griersonianum TaxID=479676 RepID=A0AAV6K5R3_9ERIC|nr:hypothetical protein RHGRI_013405 [Rhododendron griersonianum]
MEKVTGEGGWISLGPWGPEGWSRRRRCEASYKADGPVMEITVHYRQLSPVSSNDSIDAISFQSKSRDVVIGCSEIGSSPWKVQIDDSVEKLLSISLTYNNFYIKSLTFHTNRNKYGPIGTFDEKDTTYSTPRDCGVIVGFHGCGDVDCGNRLLAIGVFVGSIVQSLHSIRDPNSGPSKDKVVHLQKREEELKEEIKELKTECKELKLETREVKKEIKDVEAKNKAMEKKVDDLQKIEEEFKIEIKELKEGVAAENEGLKQRNEVMEVLSKQRNEVMSNIIVDEGGEILGPWGGHGGSFWAYKTNVTPIMEITLRYGEIIDSVLFKNYRRLNGDVVGCSNRIGGTGGHNHETNTKYSIVSTRQSEVNLLHLEEI